MHSRRFRKQMVIVNVLLVLQFLNRLHFSFQPQHNCVTSTLFNPQALNVFKNIYIKKLPSLKQNILFVGKQVFFIIEMQNIECLCFSLPQHDCATSSLFSLPQNDCVTSTPPPLLLSTLIQHNCVTSTPILLSTSTCTTTPTFWICQGSLIDRRKAR